jgi:ribonuclease HI
MPKNDGKLVKKFLLELSSTLDIDASMRSSGLSPEKAKAIFKGLAAGIPVQEELFAAVERPRPPRPCGPYEIRVDGASRGNPGQAGAGAVIRDPSGNVARELRKYLGVMTNNMAEYSALVMALSEAKAMGVGEVEVFADSELMVKQLNGKYKVKSADLLPLYNEASSLLKGFRRYKIVHVYREENGLADKLANEAIDTRAK